RRSTAAVGPPALRTRVRPGWLTARRLRWSAVSRHYGIGGGLSALAVERDEALAELLGPGHLGRVGRQPLGPAGLGLSGRGESICGPAGLVKGVTGPVELGHSLCLCVLGCPQPVVDRLVP